MATVVSTGLANAGSTSGIRPGPRLLTAADLDAMPTQLPPIDCEVRTVSIAIRRVLRRYHLYCIAGRRRFAFCISSPSLPRASFAPVATGR